MSIKIISGGQTGVDQIALRAAKAAGLATGGTAPRGWLTEDGPAPWLGTEYGLTAANAPDRRDFVTDSEYISACYVYRTRRNVEDSDLTLWVVSADSCGFRATRRACNVAGRPFRVVWQGRPLPAVAAAAKAWAAVDDPSRPLTVNVAGPRRSKLLVPQPEVQAYLSRLFKFLHEGALQGRLV